MNFFRILSFSLLVGLALQSDMCKLCKMKYYASGGNNTVCGRNGVTYKNGCYAWCNQTRVLHQGACDKNNNPCNCADKYEPVCDFEGNSYDNKCIANCYGKDASNSDFCFLSTIEENRSNSHFPDVEGTPLELRNAPTMATNDPDDGENKKNKDKKGIDNVDKYNSRWNDDYEGLYKVDGEKAGQLD